MPDLPTLLLLGDSIRMSYQPFVKELLAGRAEVVGPAENGQFALYTLSCLERWLGGPARPDVVHWNNGLHDVGHNPQRRPVQIPLADYLGDLARILARLRRTGAQVVWATTTPIAPGTPFHTDRWGWRASEIDAYNRAAVELMRSRGVPVNDLHAVVAADPGACIADDDLHLTETGQRRCAEAVVRAVGPYLRRQGSSAS